MPSAWVSERPVATTDPGKLRPSVVGGMSRVSEWVNCLDPRECQLWLVAVAALALDVWLTYLGLRLGFVEGNPVLAIGIELIGITAVGVAKLAAVSVGVVCRVLWPAYALAVPLGLAVPWLLAAALNTARLLSLVV